MAHEDEKLFYPNYQTAIAGVDISQGKAVSVAADGKVYVSTGRNAAVYGVAMAAASADSEITLYKMGASSGALARAVQGSYQVNDLLSVNKDGDFFKFGEGRGDRIWAVASEVKTASEANPLINVRLLHVNAMGLQHYTASAVINAGTPVKLDGDGAVTPVTAASDFVFGVAIDSIDNGSTGAVWRRGSSADALVRVAAGSYDWGDKLTINTSAQFVETTTPDGRFWAICKETNTATRTANQLLRAELIMGKV